MVQSLKYGILLGKKGIYSVFWEFTKNWKIVHSTPNKGVK
jgi:hypothetical protein